MSTPTLLQTSPVHHEIIKHNDSPSIDSDILTVAERQGYKIICKSHDTLQGCLYKAIRIKDNLAVAIKATSKSLYKLNISPQNGMNIVVEEDIILEGIILHHLSVYCEPPSDYIAKFIAFYQTTTHYYLCMQYVGDMTLKSFVDKCHRYIMAKRLSLREYKVISKFIFWQLLIIIHWMHQDLNCCHLDLNVENIMVQNAGFIRSSDGANGVDKVSINPELNIKIVDFGLSEMFLVNKDTKNVPFMCYKHGIAYDPKYVCPKIYNGEMYDARCADMWSLGVILYYISVGEEPYVYPNSDIDEGYFALQHRCLHKQIGNKNHSKYIKKSLCVLIAGLLDINDKYRWSTEQVLESKYLSSYYAKYKDKIHSKSRSQRQQNESSKAEWMKSFPFYKL